MNSRRHPLAAFLFIALGLLMGGCALNPQSNSSIPWSRPAGWEGQIPGMGQTSGR